MTADKGVQEFTYAFYAWNGCFAESDLVREAYDLNCPVMTVSGAAGERSLFAVDTPNVVIETVKPAEDGSGDVVVRLYESKRMATRCTLTTTLPVAQAWLDQHARRGRRRGGCRGGPDRPGTRGVPGANPATEVGALEDRRALTRPSWAWPERI